MIGWKAKKIRVSVAFVFPKGTAPFRRIYHVFEAKTFDKVTLVISKQD